MYRDEIAEFVMKTKELHGVELQQPDWHAIELVADWLLSFRQATTQMSATKEMTLSSVHAIFRGLQDDVRSALASIPDTAPPSLLIGLTAAHRKLSDYQAIFDTSPFYLWSIRMSTSSADDAASILTAHTSSIVLDPRFMYEGAKQEAIEDDDEEYLLLIEKSRAALRTYFDQNYASRSATGGEGEDDEDSAGTSGLGKRSPTKKHDFTRRYKKQYVPVDEFEDFFGMNPEPFRDGWSAVTWWAAHRDRFPNLSRLARDILSIPGVYFVPLLPPWALFNVYADHPGSAVAVERVFSGGRDTISLRRSSLKPDTIRKLMLLKHYLLLARTKAEAANENPFNIL